LIIAKQAAEFKQNFLANMSHEIRTPLTGILGMAEILERTELNEDQRDYLNTLIMSGENLRETINMVLDYSKIEAGKLQLNEEPFVFQELFDDAEKLFTGLNKNGLAMQLFIDPDIPENIVADQRRVAQVLGNLLSNAVKFTEKGKITVKASIRNYRASGQDTSERTILIEVRDTGKGISTDDQANLFKPFFQVEQAYNRSFDGTGLGLAICKELVTLMGGKIGVESQAGKGSNFWFTFSYHLAEQGDKKETESKTELPNESHSLSVLLVEDKLVNQKVVTLLLKSLGHTVTLANNGEEALDIFSTDKFQLILMDIQMPVMDGITAAQKLREKYNDLPPVIGLSANAFEGDREKYMNLGMDEYITKPVKQADFENILEKLGL
jgi:two-component system, OmpR family, aerobic respiration control sensor histidine kinase ArcB